MPQPPTTTASDLMFSEQANNNFSKTLGEIKKSTLSISNRLQSIREDAAFAQRVANAYSRPLIANERCGSWYIDPHHKAGSAYFKSTDGHNGVWKFSSRRLNLHLLEIAGKNDGCIIVDSTRRGKSMPDALSKTIPIWCSVMNRFLFPKEPQYHGLYTPPQLVSQSEQAQISALLPSFLISLRALDIPDALREQIIKPLRPIWVTPESHLMSTSTIFDDFHPIICCTVSRRVTGGEVSAGGYVQGAADDAENWACGLTPTIFWANDEDLLSCAESDLPSRIKLLVELDAARPSDTEEVRPVKPTSCLFIASNRAAISTKGTEADTCMVFLRSVVTDESSWQISPQRLDVGLGSHKLGSRNLRLALPFIVDFVEKFQLQCKDKNGDIIIACESGKDLSIGVALALSCLLFNDEAHLRGPKQGRETQIDKSFIRRKLGWISTSMPDANPSRATLQSVNSFLMERPK